MMWKIEIERKAWGRCYWLGFFRVYRHIDGKLSVRWNP